MSRPLDERPHATTVLSHLGVMVVVSAILGVVVAGLAIPFAGVLGFAASTTADSIDNLPQELETEELAQKTTIVDKDGNTIASIFDENRVNVSLNQINRRMVKALVSIEDYRFYEHGALDFKGTMRAFFTNAAASGVVQGGSTLSQQLVKQTLLQQAGDDPEQLAAATDDTYARKLKELRYAIALENRHSKDWILERYLNIVYFGDGAYGVQAAAKHYFNVNAKKLNLNQSAILAGLVQNPSAFDPTDYPDRAIVRRNVVLNKMAELNVISQKKADQVKDRGLGLDVQPNNNGCVNSAAPFFCAYVLEYLRADKSLGADLEERNRLLLSGGLTIKTTVDLVDQRAADASVAARVFRNDRAIGALAMVEPGTGEVRAIAQSRPMGRNKKDGFTFLNYIVPSQYGDSNGFQAGSTFKPFVLASALEQGIPLNRTYNSPPSMTFDSADFANCPGEPSFVGPFDIGNSTTSGFKNLYSGTRESVNTFYMQLERDTGVCKPFQLAKAMGVQLTDPKGKRGQPELVPTFTLGVADVSPLEMAEAYATFAARGLHCESRPVTQIADAGGNVLKTYPKQCEQVMQQSTADAVSDVLRGVIEGGFASAQALDQPAAGKTGTTSSGKSVWFVGYTPNMAAAAMIAGANEFGTPISLEGVSVGGSTIFGASGSGDAAPIWGNAMKVSDDRLENVPFVYPSTIVGAGEEVARAPAPSPSSSPAPAPSNNGNNGNNGRG
ncbi:transglycosylase domain-containing protein [Nocardioides sp.]|uniref:transglycosylase domain-containing protein n=1 Tax=Nocardioides sp. TaxID=35761 RepID=UPI002B2713E3|nr:transglycosylase domain-containing protein [Nocardioides sp.]